MQDSFTVKDDFCPFLQEVRASALASGFGTWNPKQGEIGSSKYDGMNFWGDHSLMVRSLAQAIGVPVFPNSMFFRVTTPETERAYIHSDRESGDWTCVAYLSVHGEPSGTGFYRHRKTGLLQMPTFQEMHGNHEFDELKNDMIHGGEKEWELLDFVRGLFNRALIFHAPLFHARHPLRGIGEQPDTARMVWVSHFRL